MLFRKRMEPCTERYWSLMRLSGWSRYASQMSRAAGARSDSPRNGTPDCRADPNAAGSSVRQGLHHEEATEDFKPDLAKGRSKLAGGMQKQLRLDAVNVRRIQKQLEQVPQQRIFPRAVGLDTPLALSAASGNANTSPITALVSS